MNELAKALSNLETTTGNQIDQSEPEQQAAQEQQAQVDAQPEIQPEQQQPEPAVQSNNPVEPDNSEKYEKRIAELEEKISGLTQKKEEPPASVNSKTISDRINSAGSYPELKKILSDVESIRKNIRSHLGKEVVEIDGKEFNRDQINQAYGEVEDAIDKLIPERINFIKISAEAKARAAKDFPDLVDQKSEGAKWANAVYQNEKYKPLLDSIPDAPYLLGLMWRGFQSVQNKNNEQKETVKETKKEELLKPVQQQQYAAKQPQPVRKFPGADVSASVSNKSIKTQEGKKTLPPDNNLTQADVFNYFLQ